MQQERKNNLNCETCGHNIYDFRNQLRHIWLFVQGIFQESISLDQVRNQFIRCV
jgi:hypothetical protein